MAIVWKKFVILASIVFVFKNFILRGVTSNPSDAPEGGGAFYYVFSKRDVT